MKKVYIISYKKQNETIFLDGAFTNKNKALEVSKKLIKKDSTLLPLVTELYLNAKIRNDKDWELV